MAASIDSSREWFEETGWHFDSNNDFVDKDGELFDFESQQEHYEYVHLEIKKLIFKELEKRFQLETYPVPSRRIDKNDQKNSPYCPQVFVSRDVMSNPNLLVIVQGLGEVPPGQWARKLFTNGKRGQFDLATQFPYIQRALHARWAVVLCDPNRDENRPRTQMTRSHHVRRVWEDIVRRSKAQCVMYVAFSAGTWSTLDLYQSIGDEFTERVKAIALLDGENGMERYEDLEDDGEWLREHSRAFSRRTMESFMTANEQTVPTNDHDSVPGIAVDAVFEYLEKEHTRHESSLLEDDLGEGTSKPAQANKDPSRPPTTKPYVPSPSQNHGSVELMKKFLHQR